jgi:hypothetical protein
VSPERTPGEEGEKKLFVRLDIKAHYLRVGVGRHHSSTIIVIRVEL